eukprot:11657305-Karenia_brevis.AAC.1
MDMVESEFDKAIKMRDALGELPIKVLAFSAGTRWIGSEVQTIIQIRSEDNEKILVLAPAMYPTEFEQLYA